MANLHNVALRTRMDWEHTLPSFRLCLGAREITIGIDFRKRYYKTSPFLDCKAGMRAGHLEILLFRKWLITLSAAR